MSRAVVIVSLLVLAWSCAGPPPPEAPPFRVVAEVHDLMEGLVYPNADGYWKSVGTIITEEGTTEIRPETEEEWEAVLGHAVALTEAGNLLMMEGRAKEEEEWFRYADRLISAGEVAIEAAEAKDPDAVFDAGGGLYVVCRDCHGKYLHEEGDPQAEMSPY